MHTVLKLTTLFLLASAAPLVGQTLPKFCAGNALVTNSLYSNILTSGAPSQVEYHGIFQNRDAQQRTITATMAVVVPRFGEWNITRSLNRFELAPHQQANVVLFTLRRTAASGTGAPSPFEAGAQIRFLCAFK